MTEPSSSEPARRLPDSHTRRLTRHERQAVAEARRALPQLTVASSLAQDMSWVFPKIDLGQRWAEQMMPDLSAVLPNINLAEQMMPSLAAVLPKINLAEQMMPSLAAVLPHLDLGQRWMEKMLPDISGLLPNMSGLLPKIDFGQRWVEQMMPKIGLLHIPEWTNVTKQVASILRLWRDLASEENRARTWARRALRAAAAAKQAVLQGRWDLVRQFVREWLDLRHPQKAHVEAAADALLEPGWDIEALDDPGTAAMLLDGLRQQTISGARQWRPIGETQTNGRAVALLDKPLRTAEPDAGTLLDLVATKPQNENVEWGFLNERLNRVLGLMTPDERLVCLAYGGAGITWTEAAVTAGFPPEFGETVRRRRTRLVDETSRRAAARSGSSIIEGR